MPKKQSFFKNHKRGIIIVSAVGITCIAAVGLIVLNDPDITKNANGFIRKISSNQETVIDQLNCDLSDHLRLEADINKNISKRKYSLCDYPFSVNSHIRRLPEGCHPSKEKILQGKLIGIDLQNENCTIVNSYMKGVA